LGATFFRKTLADGSFFRKSAPSLLCSRRFKADLLQMAQMLLA
jgi:hypothetical protein